MLSVPASLQHRVGPYGEGIECSEPQPAERDAGRLQEGPGLRQEFRGSWRGCVWPPQHLSGGPGRQRGLAGALPLTKRESQHFTDSSLREAVQQADARIVFRVRRLTWLDLFYTAAKNLKSSPEKTKSFNRISVVSSRFTKENATLNLSTCLTLTDEMANDIKPHIDI